MDYEHTYWNNQGLLQNLSEKLDARRGDENKGPKAKRLDRLSILYYDLYNNGGCNYGKEIASSFGSGLKIFNDDRNKIHPSRAAFIAHVDRVMDKAILEAYHEVFGL